MFSFFQRERERWQELEPVSVLENVAKFLEKHLCQSLFFNNVAGLRSATLLKKRLWHRCFPVNFAEFLRTLFFTEHLRWLLLKSKLTQRQIAISCLINLQGFLTLKFLCKTPTSIIPWKQREIKNSNYTKIFE